LSLVVSDTSPIRALAHLRQVELLQILFGDIHVPPAVASELRNPPIGSPTVDIGTFGFLLVSAPRDQRRVEELLRTLDLGESEALVLAQELACPAVLMDEAAGRATARCLGLLPIGTLGILVQAKQRGIVVSVMPLLDRLQTEIDFFVSSALRTEVLRLAGES
jgi:uncharacterized protein